jgi:integrase
MAEAQAGRLARHKAAVQAQMAAAIQILIVAPMRISNLAALSLVQNVLQPGGLNGPILLHIPEQDVKNGVALEYPVPQVVSDLVLTYKREFRNRLKGSNSEWLFPGEGGQAKQSKTLSEQIIKVIQRELGIRLTPHQMRHAAAALILEAEPGNYELVRRVLGHKNIQTTINFYVGLETAAAAKQYAALALRHVHTDASLRV